MISRKLNKLRLGLALLCAGTALTAVPAAAQLQGGGFREDAGTALTRHLRTLSEQPRSLSALTGAGKAALELGDPQAALTFFARAEEIAPRDGRVKSGMASAFLAMEQPRTAQRLFEEAASLGVPEWEFAGDRGLIHDLNGDPRRAQADYSLSLSKAENDEVRRRLALSQAIGGNKAQALSTIEPQLRRQDRAAWRTRAFILALGGDAQGATQAAQTMLPAQAAQLQPFLARLPALSPAQRAMAVHFGHFPEDGHSLPTTATRMASAAPAVSATARTATNSPVQSPGRTPTDAGRPDRAQKPLGNARADTADGAKPERPRREARATPERYDPWRERTGSLRSRTTEANPSRATSQPKPTTTGQPSAAGRASDAPTGLAGARQTAPAPATNGTSLGALVQALPSDRPSFALQPGTASEPPSQAPASATPTAQPQAAPLPSAETQPVRLAEAQPTAPPQPVLESSAPASGPTAPSASLQSSIVPLELPPSQPAQQTSTGSLASADTGPPAGQAAPTRFADIAAAIAALPGDAGLPSSSSSSQPERQVTARAEPVKMPAEPKADTVKEPVKTAAADKPAAKKETAASKSASAKEAAKKETAAKEAAAKDVAAKKEASAKKEEASRHWVQIAGGANEAAMTSEFKRLKAKAPKLLGDRTAWTTPLRATNRLLVGPFKTAKEAQEFVNDLAKLDLSAFSWTSPAGQEIVKLAAK